METMTASGTAQLTDLDRQIAELQAQRHQQQKATEATAKVTQGRTVNPKDDRSASNRGPLDLYYRRGSRKVLLLTRAEVNYDRARNY